MSSRRKFIKQILGGATGFASSRLLFSGRVLGVSEPPQPRIRNVVMTITPVERITPTLLMLLSRDFLYEIRWFPKIGICRDVFIGVFSSTERNGN